MKTAYLTPDTPRADITPGRSEVKMVAVNRLVPRSFITNPTPGAVLTESDAAARRRSRRFMTIL